MGKKFLLVLWFLLFCQFCHADNNVGQLQTRAFNNIKRAQIVVAHAKKLLEIKPDRQSAEICVDLYLEAAKLYGDAARLLKSVGPSYVSQEIVDEFLTAERNYLKVVDHLRRSLNEGEIISNKKDSIESILQELKEKSL